MFSALKHINCDLKMQFLCNLTAIIRKLNLRTKSPKFICKFTTIFYSVCYRINPALVVALRLKKGYMRT